MRRGGIRDLSQEIGITVKAVRTAIADGRIATYIKTSKGYEFDLDIAVGEYERNTNHLMSSNLSGGDEEENIDRDVPHSILDDEEEMGRPYVDPGEEPNPQKFFIDRDPRTWSSNQAVQAAAIFKALKVKQELDVQKGKFYDKKEADKELDRIANTFARALITLPSKAKQKIPSLTDRDVEALKLICADISAECQRKL